VRWPVVDLSLFKLLPFSATALVSLFVGAALIIAMADIPIFVNTVLQLPVLDSGLALLRLTAMIPVGALLGGWLCHRITCRATAVLGLLCTAAGFFLMSRWPIHVSWNEITISTMLAGLGFGLVIAPIGTTAINAVKTTQVGSSSALITALRMIGMMLGLAALTSWALAYFKQLANAYPQLSLTSSADQLVQWQEGYALHLIQSAHTVYSAVFFTSMILCLLAILPAFFLWGGLRVVGASSFPHVGGPLVGLGDPQPQRSPISSWDPADLSASGPNSSSPSLNRIADAPTAPQTARATARDRPYYTTGVTRNPGMYSRGDPLRSPGGGSRRRLFIAIAIACLLLLLVGAVFSASFWSQADTFFESPADPASGDTSIISGPRLIDLALDKHILTSVFVARLNVSSDVLSDLTVTPAPDDGLILTMNVHLHVGGVQRVMPVELDSIIRVDAQQNLQLTVLHFKRDGLDAGPAAASQMQAAMNQMLITAVMPALHSNLKGVKLISAHTSASVVCGRGIEMLVLRIQSPPIKGIASQSAPMPFCLNGPLNQTSFWGRNSSPSEQTPSPKSLTSSPKQVDLSRAAGHPADLSAPAPPTSLPNTPLSNAPQHLEVSI
ncbi:MAG TPA: hypothetical protein VKR06_25600, partial [Ktedonosporobacter sp.]|nr:hypothetical protein [Ktedonosporobacter sp.]